MGESSQKTETISTRLLEDVRHLHPKLQFCGEPKNAILNVSDALLTYVLSLLKNDPIPAPRVTLEKWSELLSILDPHWVLPLLFRHAGKLPDDFGPPKTILDRMRTSFRWSRTRCFRIEKQLGEIVAAFNDEHVRVLVLKGPALGRRVYPDPALRPASDLDLLVRPDDMVQSRTILEDLGYKCIARLFDAEEILYIDETFLHIDNPRNYRAIELHWRLHKYLGITQEVRTEELFRRAIKIETDAFAFEVLDPVDAFIHTAINNAYSHDDCMRLIWAYDVKMLASKLVVPHDWELLQKRCVRWRARRAVELSISMARSWLDLNVPNGFDRFTQWPQPSEIEADGWARLISRKHRLLSTITLRMPPSSGLMEKVRLLARLVFPLRDKVCSDFPPPHDLLFPLSYVRRWWDWVLKRRS
ncbi:MAG: nucleotidyltransferase family protein [Deltaproteobacteria bacterium]|nr:nucleotidyltransferase family protein [Deltaproteobacteria bacterium]